MPDTNDHDALGTLDLSVYRGWTLLLDLGYYGHRQFARLQTGGIHWLSLLHPQATYVVTATRQVGGKPTPAGDILVADETITLGSANNRRGAVIPGLRLITSRNPQAIIQRFVTDRFDLAAAEVVRLYRKRWQIELFFRFVKHHLGTQRPLGHSRAAVWLTIVVALLTAVLLAITAADRPPASSQLSWLAALRHTLLFLLRGG